MVKLILRRLGILPPPSPLLKKSTTFAAYTLRTENGLILLGSLAAYFLVLKASWLLFLLLFILPDLSLIGYARGIKFGAISYNLAHTYLAPVLLAVFGLSLSQPLLLSFSLIWSAHIAQDRLRGFGLRYIEKFDDSHLHRV